MKKLILPLIVLLTVVFFLPQKVNAQTDPECYRVYQNEEYKCLQTRTKCIQSCSSINNLKACMDSCSAQDKICSDQASADLKACLAAIPKSKVNSSTTAVQESTKPNAQTKNITCEEWKKIVGTDKCKYTVVTSTVIGDAINPRRDSPNSIWCSDAVDIGDKYINLPVDYKYATSEEQCIYDVNTNLYSGQETNNAESVGSQQLIATRTEEFEEPAGRGIGEFIRKIQSLRLGSGDQTGKPQQEVKQEPSKTSSQSVDDWILENVGIYEPSITVLNETPLKNRGPLIKQGQPNASSAIRKVAESSLIPGARISNYAEGVIVEISKGGWVYIPPSGGVIYGTQERRRYFDIMMGTVEVETNENNTEVKTPTAIVNTKGTHYWVSYDADKKETIIGVYEGKVEVKTKDGQTTTVIPDGDPSTLQQVQGRTEQGRSATSSEQGKPGIVMVSQKLSVIKLSLGGLVLVVVIGGVILILKKKFTAKGSNELPRSKLTGYRLTQVLVTLFL